jgi:hypothetical protein
MNTNTTTIIKPLKIVAFDLDETLGCFVQFGIFWDILTGYMKIDNSSIKPNQDVFNEFLDLYPEFLRPNILNILEYLKIQKQKGVCDAVFIFTNNQGPPSWAEHIRNYLEEKIKYTLFDKVIGAYEVDGIVREKCRTSHDKSYRDLLRCANIRLPTEVCFIDDLLHRGMVNPYVDYVKINPYVFHLPNALIAERALNSHFSKKYIKHPDVFKKYITVHMNKYRVHLSQKTKMAYDVDIIATKKTFHYIQAFLNR